MSVSELHRHLISFFGNQLSLSVPSVDTDLVGRGLLDSLAMIDLLFHLEREFNVTISFDNLELENFRSIASIAAFVLQENGRHDTAGASQ
jgi:methoxymalonate biosynthesis acyl carrier protein